MRSYTSLEAYEKSGLLGCMLNTLEFLRANGDQPLPATTVCDPPEEHRVWVLQELDNDESVTATLGRSFLQLKFSRVRYQVDDERFLCHLSNSDEILIVPDSYWLRDQWREILVNQL